MQLPGTRCTLHCTLLHCIGTPFTACFSRCLRGWRVRFRGLLQKCSSAVVASRKVEQLLSKMTFDVGATLSAVLGALHRELSLIAVKDVDAWCLGAKFMTGNTLEFTPLFTDVYGDRTLAYLRSLRKSCIVVSRRGYPQHSMTFATVLRHHDRSHVRNLWCCDTGRET